MAAADSAGPRGGAAPARREDWVLDLALDGLEVTRAVGMALGRALPPEAICTFSGEMGAGKTTLIKAVCEGLGIAPRHVISPTYTLANIYPGPPAVYHVDLFRIADEAALLEVDRADWVNAAGLTLIEWPAPALPHLVGEALLELSLAAPPDAPSRRDLAVRDPSGAYGAVWAALRPFTPPGC